MPLIRYKDISFSADKLEMIHKVTTTVASYKAQGYELTLRQVYYVFVSKDWFPASWADKATGSTNNERSYKKLGDLISDARMAGVLDWHAIEDRTREMDGNSHWESPQSILGSCASSYRIDKWEGQYYRPEVWVEKDALEGVVGRACRRLDIPFFSCRGYTSMTAMWNNATRLKGVAERDSVPVILHLGDHDPSGIDMSRDIEDRVRLFMDDRGDDLIFKRIALSMAQVEQYGPPENPAKVTDSRFRKYQSEYGDSSWELDALEPSVLDALIESEVTKLRTGSTFLAMAAKEKRDRELLATCRDRWSDVTMLLEDIKDVE
jgi:hypothetical protein